VVDTPLRDVARLMVDCDCGEIRRIPVVDGQGCCCGIVSQADIARRVSERAAGEVVRDVSKPRAAASRAAGA
jgi:CBS domain-containing protein